MKKEKSNFPNSDPFSDIADEEAFEVVIPPKAFGIKERVTTILEEGGTFVEQAVTPRAIEGELTVFTPIASFGEDLRLELLENLQGEPLIVHDFNEWIGENGPFITMEVSRVSIWDDPHVLVNCGGKTLIKKVQAAFSAVREGKAVPPLVGTFFKIKTGTGRDFWQVR